jgi:hypothetical protein
MPGARCTRGLVCKMHKRKRTRAYRFSGGNPAFPAQWLYGLCRALPGDEFVLSPSSANWRFCVNPVGPAKTSADLTPATGARTTRFCRTRSAFAKGFGGQARRSFREAGLQHRPSCAPVNRSQAEARPAIPVAPDAAASTASHPNVRDDGQRPSGGRDNSVYNPRNLICQAGVAKIPPWHRPIAPSEPERKIGQHFQASPDGLKMSRSVMAGP